MIFIDFMYLTCCDFYRNREAETYKISGLILLSVMFMLNIILLSILLYSDGSNSVLLYEHKYYVVIISLLIFILLLYIRYFRITNYDEIRHKIESIKGHPKTIGYVGAIVYIILSFASSLGYAFYKGGIVNGWWS